MAHVFTYALHDVSTRAYYDADDCKGYHLDSLLPVISEEYLRENLRRAYPNRICHLWGAQEMGGNFSTWNAMGEKDLLLGYRDGSIVSASYVLMKLHNPALAAQIWRDSTECPFALICFMDEPHLGKVEIVPQMLRYLDGDCDCFKKLAIEKRNNIISDYGSLDIFIRLCLGYDFPFSLRHSE